MLIVGLFIGWILHFWIMDWWFPSVCLSFLLSTFWLTFVFKFVLMFISTNWYYACFYFFRRDVLWYGDVYPSVRPGLRPLFVRPGLCPPVFHTFLLHALTYWAEILYVTLFHCTTAQVRVICINFCWCYVLFGTLNTGNTQFSALFSYMLWHIELKFCIWLCFTVLQIKFECLQFASIFLELCPFWDLGSIPVET